MSRTPRASAQSSCHANLAALTVLAAGAAAFFVQVEPVHAKSKRALFASAAQCRHLTEADMETCCYALNSRFVLSRPQKATCAPSSTDTVGTQELRSASGRKSSKRTAAPAAPAFQWASLLPSGNWTDPAAGPASLNQRAIHDNHGSNPPSIPGRQSTQADAASRPSAGGNPGSGNSSGGDGNGLPPAS